MENNTSKPNDKSQILTWHDKNDNQTNSTNQSQEQQSQHSINSSQEGSGDKYLSNGYLDDKERYDDGEL